MKYPFKTVLLKDPLESNRNSGLHGMRRKEDCVLQVACVINTTKRIKLLTENQEAPRHPSGTSR